MSWIGLGGIEGCSTLVACLPFHSEEWSWFRCLVPGSTARVKGERKYPECEECCFIGAVYYRAMLDENYLQAGVAC